MNEVTFTEELKFVDSIDERSSGVRSEISRGKSENTGIAVCNAFVDVLHR
jgi:hypothetical protein